jgi:hypothetical protein
MFLRKDLTQMGISDHQTDEKFRFYFKLDGTESKLIQVVEDTL